MVLLEVLEIMITLVIVTVVVTQIIVPVVKGTELWPTFRVRRRRLDAAFQAAREREEE